jgi:hypothetical protein
MSRTYRNHPYDFWYKFRPEFQIKASFSYRKNRRTTKEMLYREFKRSFKNETRRLLKFDFYNDHIGMGTRIEHFVYLKPKKGFGWQW